MRRKAKESLVRAYRQIRKNVFIVLKPRTVRIRDVLLNLDHKAISQSARRAIYEGSYESQESETVCRTINADDRVMEVGAGLGYITMLCAKRVGRKAVRAYEANPDLVPIVLRNAELNKVEIEIRNVLLGAADGGEERFYVMPKHIHSSRIKRSAEATEVHIKCASARREMLEWEPTYLIVDIEGGEVELIPELELRTVKRICIEVHPQLVGVAKINDVIRCLMDSGFCIDIDNSNGRTLFFCRTK